MLHLKTELQNLPTAVTVFCLVLLMQYLSLAVSWAAVFHFDFICADVSNFGPLIGLAFAALLCFGFMSHVHNGLHSVYSKSHDLQV